MSRSSWRQIIFIAFGLLLILIVTLAAFGLPVIGSLRLMAQGSVGNVIGLSRTAVKTTPLLLTGLGMVFAWRAGMYNIGGEGQFILGGLFGAVIAKLLLNSASPPDLERGLILTASVIGGAAWACLAAWLYVKRGVQVVISTILLNFVALQLLSWAVNGPLQQAKHQLPQTDLLPDTVMLWKPNRQFDFHSGFFVALLAAVVAYVLLYKTVFGFQLRLVGSNARAARANRINAPLVQFGALALSGALCGLAGGIEYTGIVGTLGTDFSQGWGFMAIPVALLGGLNPFGAVAAAAFFGAVFAGTENLARFTTGGPTLLYIVQGVAVLAVVGFQTYSWRQLT